MFHLNAHSKLTIRNFKDVHCPCYESIELEISLGKNNSFYLCGVFRPPSCKIQYFNHDFFEIIKASIVGKKCIISGDFNINLLGLKSVVDCQDFFDNFIC